ncbi:MAG: hypothetical protein NZM43_00240 [Saprospiraceae bacterium]|nr:hypothetical protein [Saprospiraceae bacterium]MDW8482729.1 hypothetical protein [Saprospiraceae bacterium]
MAYLPAQRLRLYRNFKAIDAADYHGIIRYFEEHEDDLRDLDECEYFDCAYAYAEALFAVGSYSQALVMVDHLLEWVIVHNLMWWGGRDVFAHLLWRKAEALTCQGEWTRAEYVLGEYVKLYPFERRGWRLLNRCLLRQRPAWLRLCWAGSMALVFVSLAAAAAELFVVRPFFRSYEEEIGMAQHLFMSLALLTAVGGEGYHWYHCRRKVRTLAKQIRARRNQRKCAY